jgi:DNA-binding ferritin-like protein
MPIPQPKDNEKQNDYMGRCMHKVNKDNPKMENKQQVAICLNTYNNPKKKSKAEVEIDFSEQIKNMNKQQEIKIEEAPKIEAKIEVPSNTAVTAPVPEIKAQDIVDIPDDQNTESLDGEKIQTSMLQMQKQYQIFHWQTTSFSQHKSFGKIYELLDESIDTFIETYMGKYGRVIAASKFNLEMSNYSDLNFVTATNSYIEFLIGLNDMLDETKDSDLLNTRDEILGSLNRLKYLLTLQ